GRAGRGRGARDGPQRGPRPRAGDRPRHRALPARLHHGRRRVTDPKLAVATDNGRYYRDPAGGPDLISVTNVIDTCVNKPVLVPWAAKVTAEYVMANLPTIVRRSLRERDEVM